jgi:hypothetical protein
LRVGTACTIRRADEAWESREGIEPSHSVLRTGLPPTDPARDDLVRRPGIAPGSRGWRPRLLLLKYRRALLERTAGLEPASTVWKTVVLPLDDARIRGATRGNCTRRLLDTSEVPRYLGLGGDGGAGRNCTGYLLSARQALYLIELRPPAISAFPVVERRGIEPRFLPCEGRVLPFELLRPGREPGDRTRLARVLEARRRPSPAPCGAHEGNRTPLTRLTIEPLHQMRTRAMSTSEWPRLRFCRAP